jgi:PAS domain S-box-containing protein
MDANLLEPPRLNPSAALAQSAPGVSSGPVASMDPAALELQALYAAAPFGLAFFDRNLRCQRINERLAAATGSSARQQLGRYACQVLPGVGSELESVLRQALVSGEPPPDMGVVDDGGPGGERRHWVHHWSAVRSAEGLCIGLSVMVEEVTPLRNLQARVRRADLGLSTIADNAPAIIARFDRALRHLFVNKAIEVATGRPRIEFIGRTNREMGMPQALCDEWDTPIARAFETGEAQQVSFEFPSPGGARHFRAVMVPEVGEDGEVESVLSVVHDVTDIRKSEAALRDADRRKDQFLATLSHELRSPLAALRNALWLLRRDEARSVRGTALGVANRQLEQLTRLVDDLLEVSRISRGKVTLRPERLDLGHSVRAQAQAWAPILSGRAQRLELELPDAPLKVFADPLRLNQVLENLIANASKYSDAGGRIGIRAAMGEGEVALEVSDDGIGIDPANVPMLFEFFSQIDASMSRSHGGLGIGLALVKHLVALHGGRVEVRSDGVGRGSTFTVRLPVGEG